MSCKALEVLNFLSNDALLAIYHTFDIDIGEGTAARTQNLKELRPVETSRRGVIEDKVRGGVLIARPIGEVLQVNRHESCVMEC